METRNRKKTSLALASIAGLALAATSAPAAVVYQDNFDGDGLATNTGVGGGLDNYARQGGSWFDDGAPDGLDTNLTGNNDRGNATTQNAFNLDGGFELMVTYTIADTTTADANRAQFGLLDAADLPAVQDNSTYVTD